MKVVFTLLASAAAFAITVGNAQAYGDNNMASFATTATKSTLTRAEVAADLSAYRASGLADLDRVDADRTQDQAARAQAEQRYQQLRVAAGLPTQAPVVAMSSERNREDVVLELRAYRQSGLADLDRMEGDSPAKNQARAQAEQRYQQLLSAERAHAAYAK